MDPKYPGPSGSTPSTRVLIVDDHPVVRDGYRRLLESTGEITIIAEADTGDDGYNAYKEHLPDVVVMDLALPGSGGLNAIRRITQRDPNARVLAFSVHEDPVYLKKAQEAGAIGYVSKRSAPKDLVTAVYKVALGEHYFVVGDDNPLQALSDEQTAIHQLTPREFEVFQLLAQGFPVSEIAETLSISQNTAGVHQARIMGKLQLQNSAQLARLAIRNGIVDP